MTHSSTKQPTNLIKLIANINVKQFHPVQQSYLYCNFGCLSKELKHLCRYLCLWQKFDQGVYLKLIRKQFVVTERLMCKCRFLQVYVICITAKPEKHYTITFLRSFSI